jgi:hypothetical protein
VLPYSYTLVVRLKPFAVTGAAYQLKKKEVYRFLPLLSVLTMGSRHTKPPPYDFLNLYGACLQAPMTPKVLKVVNNLPHYAS